MTSPTPFKRPSKSPDLERIFLDHYDWLFNWARQLTRGTSEDAEDLVQDFYVRFVQMKSAPEFEDEDHIKAYLYKALKNMFVSRKMRQGRDAISGLSVIDFDSIEAAMSSVDRSQLLYVRSDLAGICEYTLIRRKSNKAASAFTLRYFFGYLPSEVRDLLRINRTTLDALLQTARLEARAYLTRPSVLRFLDRREKKAPAFPRHLPERSDELFVEIQRRILSETEGECLGGEEMSSLYLGAERRSFTLQQAAHLVSCATCLTEAIRLLGLPDLLLQLTDGGTSSGGRGGIDDDAVPGGVMKLRRKLREVYEHRPKKLQIAVDGQVLGIQTVNGVINNLQIKLQPLQQPSFIEVLSEQGVGLLYLDVQEIPGHPEPHAMAVDLSDGRQLSASLILSGDANAVEIYYYDPLFGADPDEPPSASAPSLPDSGASVRGGRARWSIFHKWGHGFYRSGVPDVLRKFRVLAIGLCLLPLGVAGAIFGLRWMDFQPPVPTPTGASLLVQSAARESDAIPRGGSVRRTFSVIVESSPGKVVQEGRVRQLSQPESSRSAIELRSSTGKLLAGRWVNRDGDVVSFPTPQRSGRSAADRLSGPAIAEWQRIPDATTFRDLTGDDSKLTAHRHGDEYIVSFSKQPETKGPTVVEAELVLTESNLHPIAETLVVQSGDTNQRYTFREVRYELLRADQVDERDFQPSFTGSSQPSHIRQPFELSTSHLLLRVLRALNALGPQVERTVDVERGSDGQILVSGVLNSGQQKLDLIRELRSLQEGSRIRLAVHAPTDDQPLSRLDTSLPIQTETVSVTNEQVPMDAYLRERIGTHVKNQEETQHSILETAGLIVEEGTLLRRASWWVDQIGETYFPSNDLRAMSLSDRRSWLDLLGHHLDDCRSSINRLRSDLFIPGDVGPPPPLPPLRSANELATSAEKLAQHGERLDRLLQDGFTVSASPVKSLHTPEELEQLLAAMNREERTLHATVKYLQQIPGQPR